MKSPVVKEPAAVPENFDEWLKNFLRGLKTLAENTAQLVGEAAKKMAEDAKQASASVVWPTLQDDLRSVTAQLADFGKWAVGDAATLERELQGITSKAASKDFDGAVNGLRDFKRRMAARHPAERTLAESPYLVLLRPNKGPIETALTQRGGKQIKFFYDQATTFAGQQNWAKAIPPLNEAIRLTTVAAARNPYLAVLDPAKPIVEPLLGVKVKTDDPNVTAINLARDKLKILWEAQDGHAKKKEYPAAIEKANAARLCAETELKPLIAVKALAATAKLAAAELAVDRAKSELATTPSDGKPAKLREIRTLVEALFTSADEAKDVGVLASGAVIGGGGKPDREINCEKMYRELDWFELKRRLNLPEMPDVEPEDRANLTPGEMRQLFDWRSVEVNKLIDGLRAKYPTLIAKACGSNDLESDIDITFSTPNTPTDEHFGDDILAAKEFNQAVITRFGKPAGRTFDVNIYAKDYRAIKESRNQEYNAEPIPDVDVGQPGVPTVGGMDFRTASAEDQDVAALMKQRRFMSTGQWQEYNINILADLEKQLKAKRPPVLNPKEDKTYIQVAKQLEEADDVYLLSLRKILVGIQKTVAKRYPAKLSDPNFVKLELLLRDPNAKNVEAEMQKLHKLLTSGENAGVAMEATDEMYLDQMNEVRINQKKLETMPESPAKEALKIQVKKDIFTNIFFANEAYTSEGAITHIVAGSQAGLTTEELAAKLKPTETVQSANEQLADLLKDMEHFEDEEHAAIGADAKAEVAGQAFVHASKYLERLLDATAILAAQFAPKTETDPPAPDLVWFAENVKDTEVTGKTTLKDKAEALQKRVKGLLLNLRKSSKVPGDLKRPIAVGEVQQLFGVSNIQAFSGMMMKLGQELNSVVRMRGEFQTALAVDKDVTVARMKTVDVGEKEKALNVIRKLASDPRVLPAVPILTDALSKLDVGAGPEVSKLASELCAAWTRALGAHAEKRTDRLTPALVLLRAKVKAIPDVEVANEFQGVESWFDQANVMLALTAGPTATPETRQIVANINQAEVLIDAVHSLTFGAAWEQSKPPLTAMKKAKLLEDMDKEKVKIAPLLEQLEADVIEEIPAPVKQRIVDVLRDLNGRAKDLERRRGELVNMAVVAG